MAERLFTLVSCVLGGPLPPYHLKCENNHVGLTAERMRRMDTYKLFATDNHNPLFSWTVAHTERAARQSAFRVIVAEDGNLNEIIWDSGKIFSSDKTSLRYAGQGLRTAKTYFWKVMWWDNDDKMASSEETGHFLAAVLDPKDWDVAKWIAAGDDIKSAPYLHKTFEINSSLVTTATLFVSGLGFNRPFVNGTDLNAQYDPPIALTPEWTNYEKLVPYTSYEITSQAQKCANKLTIGVMLGMGWRNSKDYPLQDPGGILQSDSTERVLRVLLYVVYDKSAKVIPMVTDETWSVDDTNITSDSIYNGVNYGFF